MLLWPWPARWPVGLRPLVEEHPLTDPGGGIWFGDFVQIEDDDEVDLFDSDNADANCYGVLAEWPYTAGWMPPPWMHIGSLFEGRILLYRVSRSITFALEGTRAPVLDDIGEEYGLTIDTEWAQWAVDLDETGDDVCAEVVDVSIPRGLFFIKILASRIQADI